MRSKPLFLLVITSILLGSSLMMHGQYSVTDEKYSKINVRTTAPFQKALRDSLFLWQEQIVLHTDKKVLRPKDLLFFKAYVLTGPDQLRVSSSAVLKVEILNKEGVLLASQYHRITDGASEGSIQIPKNLKDGDYYFRAYTRWMLNYGPESFANQRILIRSDKNRFRFKTKDLKDITFYPEGGQLVAGLTQQVAVRLSSKIDLQFPVINSSGEEIAMVKNYGTGIGTFILTPVKGDRYFLKLDKDRKIPLPGVMELGYSLRVNNLNDEKAYIMIEASPELQQESVYLKGEANGILYFDRKVEFEKDGTVQIEIPKAALPMGLLEVRLEDDLDQIWARRPLYIDKKELQIAVERQSPSEGREILKFKVTDRQGLPVKTTLSVGLSSQDAIEEITDHAFPGTFGNQTLRSQSYVNDLSVLTGNFSDTFKSDSKSSIPEKILYNFQKGLEFYGQAYDLNNSLLTNTKIQVLLTTSDDVVVKEAETSSDGLFTLSGIQISGEITMVFRTMGEETKTKLVKVIPYEYEIPPLHKGAESSKAIEKNPKLSNNLLPKKPMRLFSSMEEAERLIMLNEITLVATKELERESPSIYNLEPTRLIHQNPDKPKTIPQLFLNIPGIQVSGLGDLYPSLSIPRAAGLGPLLWVIDGFPLNQDTNLVDIMNLLSYSDVDRIEILIGAEASMYGSRASGGVISIYTRSGATNEYLNRKDAQITYQGFHESVNFSAYQEGGNWNRKNVADRSTTFYWDPYLQTDDNGEAIISLSTPTQVNQIKIEANAITENGLRGNLITIF